MANIITKFHWYATSARIGIGGIVIGYREKDTTRGVTAWRNVHGELALTCEANSVEDARAKFQKWASAAEDGGDYYG